MSQTNLNSRTVEVEEKLEPIKRFVSISDTRFVCDNCGKSEVVEWNSDVMGKWYPDGWMHLNGVDWPHTVDLCSFACQTLWLELGKWRPLVEAQRAKWRQYRIDHPEDAARVGDA